VGIQLCLPSDYRPFSSQPSQAWHRLTQSACLMPKLTTGLPCGTAPYSRTERSPHARTWRTRHSLQLQQLLVSTWSRLHTLGKGRSRSNSITHSLFTSSSKSSLAGVSAGSHGSTRGGRQRRRQWEQQTLHASDRISRVKISG
jgi:hypothetical protein